MPILADIHYQVYEGSREGRREPVVLIHGAGGNYLSWPTELRRMPGCRVFSLDLPGHGNSSGVGRQSIQDYAESIERWLAAAGLNQVILAGHSMGSAIAIHLALVHPDIVQGLVLIGAGSRLKVNPALLEDFNNPTTFMTGIEKIVAWSFSDQAPNQLVEGITKRMSTTRPGVLYGDFLACSGFDVTNRLAEIKQPVLVLCGEMDKMTPCRNSQYLADQIERSVLKIIPGAGHMVMLEQPEVVADEVDNFLSILQIP